MNPFDAAVGAEDDLQPDPDCSTKGSGCEGDGIVIKSPSMIPNTLVKPFSYHPTGELPPQKPNWHASTPPFSWTNISFDEKPESCPSTNSTDFV